MTRTGRHAGLGSWHILGAGRIGSLAAAYLKRAGAEVVVVRPGPAHVRQTTLTFAGARTTVRKRLELRIEPPQACAPIARLLLACKTPYTDQALSRVELADDATVLRLQNGIGNLETRLKAGQRLISGVTASAVMGDDHRNLRVVAENATTFGGGTHPEWFDRLAAHWPGLAWAEDIRPVQWRKLIANAAINPLTAIHDVPNGQLLERADLRAEMAALIDEADALLAGLNPAWPGGSQGAVAEVVRATAANTSSMRADFRSAAATEIDAINGWLLREAEALGMELATHRRIVARVHALERRRAD